jgi:hypothetical protein
MRGKEEVIMSFRKVFLCSLLALFLGVASGQSGWGKEPAKSKEPVKTEKGKSDLKGEIQRALDETTQMEFTDTPLTDVIDYLKDLHKQKHPSFEIQLDMKVLQDLGITGDTPITKNLMGVSLRSALRMLLRDLGLTYVIRHEVLLITSPEESCYTRVYDVADLASPKVGGKNSALESLRGMIVKTCPPSGPTDKSGWPGWIATLDSAEVTTIVVHQPDEFQDEVAELLAQLRAAKHPK